MGPHLAGSPPKVCVSAPPVVSFNRYDVMVQDDCCIWTAPDARVAWFRDPDGDDLSLQS